MPRITIANLPKDNKISKAEIKKIIGGTYPSLVYLDVWQRPITALEDPELSDVAAGGPSTESRPPCRFKLRKKSIF